jgi:alpha-glucosidase
MSYYSRPKSILGGMSDHEVNADGIVKCTSDSGICIEVVYFNEVGWSMEVRYDEVCSGEARQPYTGCQGHLVKRTPEVLLDKDLLSLKVGYDNLSISRSDFRFEVRRQDATLLRSSNAPFIRHPDAINVFEMMSSLRSADLSQSFPHLIEAGTFKSFVTSVCLALPEGPVLGLPGQTGELNRRGYRFELYNFDRTKHTADRPSMYQSWPVLFFRGDQQEQWVCVFHDNPSRTFVDIGDFYPNEITFESVSNNSRIYILSGDTLGEVSTKLIRLLGDSIRLPVWAFGYQQARWSYMSTTEIREIVSRFKECNMPLDAIYWDIDYMDKYKVFTFNRERFADAELCIDQLRGDGIESVFIVDPGIKVDKEFKVYNDLLEDADYLKDESGKPFVGQVWPGDVIFPEFSSQRTTNWWAKYHTQWLEDYHFAGCWNDMNEPANWNGQNKVTSKAITMRGSLEDEFNLYGYYMAKASFDALSRSFNNRRFINISRAGYPGIQRYAVIWHGDNHAWWEHLKLALHTVINYALCGVFYTGPDVPGFSGSPANDLAVRFFQLGAFLPFYRGHSAFFEKNKEPYVYAEPWKSYIHGAINLRYSLIREWISGFEHAYDSKVSPVMPVFTADKTLISDQFLLFNKLLIAPVIERDAVKRLVYLPKGSWYRLDNNNDLISGNRFIVVDVDLNTIPVFVKAGSILIRNTPNSNVISTLKNDEEVVLYPDDKDNVCRGIWYDLDLNDGTVLNGYQLIGNVTSGMLDKVPL